MMEAFFDKALYSLDAKGAVSEPVKTASGFHIIRLDEVKPEVVKSFEEVRGEVERSLKLHKAEALFFDAADNLANLSFENPDSLQPAAEALDLKLTESDWITKSSTEGIAQYPKVKETAFGVEVMQNGVNSEPLEVEPSHIIVIRKLDYKEPTALTVDQARDDIVDQIKNDKARDMIQKKAEALLEEAKQGKTLEVLAEKSNVELKTTDLIKRTDGSGDIDSTLLTEAFHIAGSTEDSQTPLVGLAKMSSGDYAIFNINKIVPGKTEDLDEAERDALIERLASQIGSTEFDALLQSRRQQTDIVTYNDRL
jgi:peptidyl-prolyl cis-trans isomerase D